MPMTASPDGYEVRQLGQMERAFGGALARVRAELGITAFGVQVVDLPPNSGELAPEHDHNHDGQEELYLRLYDERIRLHGYSPEPMSKTEVRGFYEQIFRAFGTPTLEFNETLWERDTCTIRFTMTGRHIDAFMGVAPTDFAITLPGITILHFEGVQVIERFSQTDMLGLLVQIGAVPAPA